MTLENFKELIRDRMILSQLPGLPWRLKFPIIATLDVDGYHTPNQPGQPLPGTSAAYGKGYANGLSDADTTRIPMTEGFMRLYFNDEAMQKFQKLMRDMMWARPFGNPLYNLWGGTYESYSNWQVTAAEDGKQHFVGKPLTEAFYQKLRPYFTAEQIREMKQKQVEEVAFDRQGNSVWCRQGVMDGVPGPFEGHPTRYNVFGSMVIVGGTGRYTDASGNYQYTGYSDMVEQPATGQPHVITRLGCWGTIECWWPSPRAISLTEITEEDIREFAHPQDIYQQTILQQAINEQLVTEKLEQEEAMAHS